MVDEALSAGSSSYKGFMREIHPKKPDWYEHLYAKLMRSNTCRYNAKVGDCKAELFSQLDENVKTILEMGVGTGANFEYLSDRKGLRIIGVDPNTKMEKHARESFSAAGLSESSKFEFVHGVSERLPVESSSVDAVISTLVLCSVKDVEVTLKEVQRVLKPGGIFIFLEHVVAQDGSWLKFFQTLFNPLQVLVGDGCHFTRDILTSVENAEFARVEATSVMLKVGFPLVSPHVKGTARNKTFQRPQ